MNEHMEMERNESKPTLASWKLATRPKTLPAAVAPVLVGSAAAASDGSFALLPSLAALAGALLLQIGVNLANDYFDCKSGIDTPERLGPVRVTQSGLIAPETVKNAMIFVFFIAGLAGLYLTAVGGLPVFVAGVAAILSALAYSGGPFPLASHALGDLFVFIFFGLVAVCGTYYVQTLRITGAVFWLSVPVGFLITAIIVVNNLRDIKTDRKTGKITLAVLLGEKGAVREFNGLLGAAYLALPVYFSAGLIGPWGLLPLLSAPRALAVARAVGKNRGKPLNESLAATAGLAIMYSALLSAGLLLD